MSDPRIIEQRRSRIRVRLTACIGAAITIFSATALMWLLGLFDGANGNQRVTVNMHIIFSCSRPIYSSVHVDLFEGTIFIEAIPSHFSKELQLSDQSLYFKNLNNYFTIDCPIEIFFKNFDSLLSKNVTLQYEPTDDQLQTIYNMDNLSNTIKNHGIFINTSELKYSQGRILIQTDKLHTKDSFGRYHVGLDILFTGQNKSSKIEAAISLPSKSMSAEIIRPTPVSINNNPIETYRFDLTSQPNGPFASDDSVAEGSMYIAFVDPEKIQVREALLITASTFFGAGVSAMLEAFLAGGAALVPGHGSRRGLRRRIRRLRVCVRQRLRKLKRRR